MKKLLLASVLAIASVPGFTGRAIALDIEERPLDELLDQQKQDCENLYAPGAHSDEKAARADYKRCLEERAEADKELRKRRAAQQARDENDRPKEQPPARVTVAPSPPPIGWVYGPYTSCANPPQCSMGVVNVPADGLNVRTVPNGYPVMSLVNGTPFYPLQKQGDWLLVAPACDVTPTWAWSWNAGVPLNRCWVYF